MFNNLAVRLLAVMVLVATASIAATAWLAAKTTTGAMRRSQTQSIEGDTRIYTGLLAYAATHKDWKGVGPTLRSLAAETGRRVLLTTTGGAAVADSNPGRGRPSHPAAEVDALNVNLSLVPNAPSDGIDGRVLGPFKISDGEYNKLLRNAQLAIDLCATKTGVSGFRIVTDTFDGRPKIVGEPGEVSRLTSLPCYPSGITSRLDSQRKAFAKWRALTTQCLIRRDVPDPLIDRTSKDTNGEKFQPTERTLKIWNKIDPAIANDCVLSARKEMLSPYVAPPARIYLGTGAVGLADVGRRQTVAVAGLVLVVTVGAAWLAARRLTRPIGVLTEATTQMGAGDHSVRVKVGSGDELGRLAASFNSMAEELERNERNRKSVMSDVAHELRNPLANINGWLEAAEDGVAELDKDLISFLMGESQTLQRLVNDLQDLALAEAGRLTLHLEELALPELLDQIATAHRSRADDVDILVEAAPVTLTADPVRLRQAIGNLVGNALRHTPPGGTVTLTATGDGISVADTGAGIAPEHLPHVFDRFWRADRSRARATGGSGLGLSITKQLVEAHGYTLTVTSTLGKGSTFTIHLL
jgi:two-component system sensor histidine kinase BaeS